MATLEQVVTAIQADLATVAVTYRPATPPEHLAAVLLPALVVYAGNGNWQFGSSDNGEGFATRWGVHTITIDLHLEHTDLPLNIAEAMPYADSIPNTLFAGFMSDQFGGTVTLMGDKRGSPPLRYELIGLNWGGLTTVGWRFSLDVCVEDIITP